MKTNFIDRNENKMLEELGITNASPFKTPDGYFDTLTARVMENIPSEEAPAESGSQVIQLEPRKRQTLLFRWAVAAAACFLLVFTGVRQWNQQRAEDNLVANNIGAWDEYDEDYAEELLSYTGMDETDVYNYLSGTEY